MHKAREWGLRWTRRKEGDGLATGAGLELRSLRADLGGGCGGNGEQTGLRSLGSPSNLRRASLAVALVEERAPLLDILTGRKRRDPAQFLDLRIERLSELEDASVIEHTAAVLLS